MPNRQFRVLVDWDPEAQAWVTLVPGLGDLSTFGETREEALAQNREAILGYLEAARREGGPARRAARPSRCSARVAPEPDVGRAQSRPSCATGAARPLRAGAGLR